MKWWKLIQVRNIFSIVCFLFLFIFFLHYCLFSIFLYVFTCHIYREHVCVSFSFPVFEHVKRAWVYVKANFWKKNAFKMSIWQLTQKKNTLLVAAISAINAKLLYTNKNNNQQNDIKTKKKYKWFFFNSAPFIQPSIHTQP